MSRGSQAAGPWFPQLLVVGSMTGTVALLGMQGADLLASPSGSALRRANVWECGVLALVFFLQGYSVLRFRSAWGALREFDADLQRYIHDVEDPTSESTPGGGRARLLSLMSGFVSGMARLVWTSGHSWFAPVEEEIQHWKKQKDRDSSGWAALPPARMFLELARIRAEGAVVYLRWFSTAVVLLGLLGTFIGLAATISDVIPLLNAGDSAQLGTALEPLTSAFFASIAGVVSSFALTLLRMVYEANVDESFSSAEAAITRVLPRVLEWKDPVVQLREAAMTLGDLSKRIESSTTEILAKSETLLEEAVQKTYPTLLKQIEEVLPSVGKSLSEKVTTAADAVLSTSHTKNLEVHKKMSDDFRELTSQLGRVMASAEKITNQIENAPARVASSINSVLDKHIEEATRVTTDSIRNHTTEIEKQLATAREKWVESHRHEQDRIRELAEGTKALHKQVQDTVQARLKEMAVRETQSANQIEGATAVFREAVDSIATAHTNTTASAQEAATTFTSVKDEFTSVKDELHKLSESIKESVTAANNNHTAANEAAKAQLVEAVRVAGEDLRRIVQDVTTPVLNTATAVGDTAAKTTETATKALEAMNSATTGMKTAIQSELGHLKGQQAELKTSLGHLAEALQGIEPLISELKRTTESNNKATSTATKSLTEAAAKLERIADLHSKEVIALEQALEQLQSSPPERST